MAIEAKTSTDVLEELMTIESIKAVVVIGRDGFVIEYAGSDTTMEMDALGASVAGAIMRIENTGAELNVEKYQDMHVEYGKAMIMCVPVGDAIVTIVARDSSALGTIRYKVKKAIPALKEFL